MYVFVRIRYSQALRLVPCLYWCKAANALVNVSWTRSSASAGLRVVRSAALYSWSRNGMASASNRVARWAAVSVLMSRVGSSPLGSSTLGASAVDVFDVLGKSRWSAVIAIQPNADGGRWLP